MRGDILVLDAGEALNAARYIHDRLARELDDVDASDEQLTAALRMLRAVGYRAHAAARLIDRLARIRAAHEQTPGRDGGPLLRPLPSVERGETTPDGASPGVC